MAGWDEEEEISGSECGSTGSRSHSRGVFKGGDILESSGQIRISGLNGSTMYPDEDNGDTGTQQEMDVQNADEVAQFVASSPVARLIPAPPPPPIPLPMKLQLQDKEVLESDVRIETIEDAEHSQHPYGDEVKEEQDVEDANESDEDGGGVADPSTSLSVNGAVSVSSSSSSARAKSDKATEASKEEETEHLPPVREFDAGDIEEEEEEEVVEMSETLSDIVMKRHREAETQTDRNHHDDNRRYEKADDG